jgi:hypothetical protein
MLAPEIVAGGAAPLNAAVRIPFAAGATGRAEQALCRDMTGRIYFAAAMLLNAVFLLETASNRWAWRASNGAAGKVCG